MKAVFSVAVWIALLIAFLSMPHRRYWTLKQNGTTCWLQSPKDGPEFVTAVTSVQPFQTAFKGPNYASKDFYGDYDVWGRKTAYRVQEYGFKAIGAWSNKSVCRYMPYTLDLNLLLHTTVPISSPEWESQIDRVVRQEVVPEDTNLIGYYLDNEINWNVIDAEGVMKYFEITCRLVRRYDANHLILGVRFNYQPPERVLRFSRGLVDVQSVNLYYDSVDGGLPLVRRVHEETGLPVIISEFSFYARQNRSGDSNSKGFGGLRQTQEDRAEAYRQFVTMSQEIPYVVGYEWFQWNDEPPGGRVKDGENCNFGIVDIMDRPYSIIETVRETTRQANRVHWGK